MRQKRNEKENVKKWKVKEMERKETLGRQESKSKSNTAKLWIINLIQNRGLMTTDTTIIYTKLFQKLFIGIFYWMRKLHTLLDHIL